MGSHRVRHNWSDLAAAVWSIGRGTWGSIDTCICMAESLCCLPETITILLIGYTPIYFITQNKKFLKIKKKVYLDLKHLHIEKTTYGISWAALSQMSQAFKGGKCHFLEEVGHKLGFPGKRRVCVCVCARAYTDPSDLPFFGLFFCLRRWCHKICYDELHRLWSLTDLESHSGSAVF